MGRKSAKIAARKGAADKLRSQVYTKILFEVTRAVKVAGEDPNLGRVVMAIGKAGPKINLKKLLIKFGNIIIVEGGRLNQSYDEKLTAKYMKSENIKINIETFTGNKSFTAYTMDLTKKYIEINADYRS